MKRALMIAFVLGCGAARSETAASTEPASSEPVETATREPLTAEGCVTPWYLDPARGADTLTCRTEDGTEVSTECEACALRDGVCFADRPGEIVERRALDGTHHRFSASHTCVAACCAQDQLTLLPPHD